MPKTPGNRQLGHRIAAADPVASYICRVNHPAICDALLHGRRRRERARPDPSAHDTDRRTLSGQTP